MLVRIALGALALPLMVQAAHAASFDCDKASSTFERAICEFPELSTQDEILAKAYATALGGLSQEAASMVQKGQREWLDFAERACTEDAQPQEAEYDQDDLSCLTQVFSNRIRWLEQSRMRSGRRVYQFDSYVVIPDPDATEDSWNKVATKEFTAPRIDGTDAEAVAFNAMMDEMPARSDAEIDPTSDATSDNQVQTIVDAITSRRISLVVNDWWYGHGAAHGNYTITYVHFLSAEGRLLEATDIFAGEDWQKPLEELVLAELNRTIEGGIWPEAVESVGKTAANPQNWNFSDQGLIVQFQPYEVTAYAYGAPTVTIPWIALEQYTAAGAIEITGSY